MSTPTNDASPDPKAVLDRLAYPAIVALARSERGYLSMDDVVPLIADAREGVDRRRLGPVMQRAKRDGLIEPADMMRSRRSKVHHGGEAVWRVIHAGSSDDSHRRRPPEPEGPTTSPQHEPTNL
jgi:hypothetical protein